MEKEIIDKLMRVAIDSGKNSVSEEGKLSPKVGAAIFKDGQILGSSFRGVQPPFVTPPRWRVFPCSPALI